VKRICVTALLVAAFAYGQDPIVGTQRGTTLDNLCRSGSETTGVISANGQEFISGFVDFREDGTIKNGFSVSSDAGVTWTHLVVRPPVQYQDTVEADPMTAYDARTNTLFAGGISRGKCLYVAKKLPGQNAFSPSVVARLSTWPDKGWMAAGARYGLPDTTRLYIAYNEGVIWSDDLGATWTPPTSLGVGYGFLPRVGPNGELYITYWDGYWGIKFSSSFDGGQTWTAPVQPATRLVSWGVESYGIPGQFRNVTNNAMAVNPVNGDIVILYYDQTNIVDGQKNLDLYFVRSHDDGETWTPARRLPFRPLSQVSDMVYPWVEFSGDGRLHLMAMDTSFNPGQIDGVPHGFWDQVYYYSDDEGDTWSQRFRLTPTSWDSYNDGTGLGFRFLGDYQGMAMNAKSVWPVYPDTRTGQAEVYVNQIYNPIERPDYYAWIAGEGVGGSLSSLYLKDANVATAVPGPNVDYGSSAQMETRVPVPVSNPSSLKVCIWSEADFLDLEQRIQLYDTVAETWDTIDIRPAPKKMANVTVAVPSPGRYIEANTVRVRLIIRSFFKHPITPWSAKIDQNVLLVVP
jgi:hypothetical protein